MKFKLSYACNTDDRHWINENGDCYKVIDFVEVMPGLSYIQSWRIAFNLFTERHPRLMCQFGLDARIAVSNHKMKNQKNEIALDSIYTSAAYKVICSEMASTDKVWLRLERTALVLRVLAMAAQPAILELGDMGKFYESSVAKLYELDIL